MPTRNGPITKAVSSAADSYDIARVNVRARTSGCIRSRISAMTRLRLIAAACGAVTPIRAATISTIASGMPDSTTSGKVASSTPLMSPTGTRTVRCP
jgi:hypothetical protein